MMDIEFLRNAIEIESAHALFDYDSNSEMVVSSLSELKEVAKNLGVDLEHDLPVDKKSKAIVQIAHRSGLIALLLQKPFSVEIGFGLVKLIAGAREGRVKEVFLARAMPVLSILIAIAAVLMGFWIGVPWYVALFLGFVTYFSSAAATIRLNERVIRHACLNSYSLLQFLWERRLLAIYDVGNSKTYDCASSCNWLSVIGAIVYGSNSVVPR